MKNTSNLIFLWLFLILGGCGSAEAIKAYHFKTTKANLEGAVNKAIRENSNIFLDTTQRKVIVRRYPNRVGDTTTIKIYASQYQGKERNAIIADNKAYLKIKIRVGPVENHYEFRYLGDEQYWKTSPGSAIFISEARDNNGHVLRQGHNEKGQFKTEMAKDLINLFEKEFVTRIVKELKLQHTPN